MSESNTVLLGNLGLGVDPGIVYINGRRYLSIKGDSSIGVLELGSGAADAENIPVGTIHYIDANCTGVEKRIGNFAYFLEGTTPSNRGGRAVIALKQDNGIGLIERFIVHSDGVMDVNDQSGFRAYQSTAQSLTAATETMVLFQTKDYDNQNEFDPTNSVFTAKRAGIYMISCGVGFNQPISNRVLLRVRKNGQVYETLSDITSSVAEDASFHGSTIVKLSAGDYLDILINSFNPVTCFNLSSRTFFSAIKIA